MTPPVVVLVPVLARPHRVRPTLDSIRAATPEPHRILFLADEGDASEIRTLERAGADYLICGGNYAAKINRGCRETSEPYIFTAADDLEFHPGWYSRALGYMSDTVRVVGTNDLCNQRTMLGQHSTHTLIARDYIEETGGVVDEGPGTVLHEGYAHEYTDDEFIGTAMSRGVYAHAFDSLVEHLHPLVNKAPDDTTYQTGRARTPESRRLFMERRNLWMRPDPEWP